MTDSEIVTPSETILDTEADRVRGLLRRYLSPRIADAVLEERHAALGPGQVGVVSILFCDLRGFTAYAERIPPPEVARSLNEFLEQMTQVVFKYDGVLDKYTGDGLIALFGVPYPQPDHAERAVHTALEMQARHDQLMKRWAEEGKARLGMGVGIQSGEVLAGNFGSSQRVDYTVIGHAVNVAARLTAVAPAGQILLGDATRQLAREIVETEPLGHPSLKNIQDPVEAFRLVGLRPGTSAFCFQCGARIERNAGMCPHCGAHQDLAGSASTAHDGLVTVARIAATLTSVQLDRGPHLIAVAGPHQGSDFAVTFPCALGREALTNQVVLSFDPSVSRRHAVLRRDDGGTVVVADLASQNGTYVNDEPVSVAPLHDGDLLTLGRTRLVVSGLRDPGTTRG